MKVAVIGLGAMGQGMAVNLTLADFTVRGFDTDKRSMSAMQGTNVILTNSAKQAADAAEIVFIVVFHAKQAKDLLFGNDAILDSLATGAVIVMNTTVAPEDAVDISDQLKERGFGYIDAPVTGGKKGADEASMTIIAAGPDPDLEKVEGTFDAISAKVYRISDTAGAASTVKMINQMLVGINVAATCEALAFATRAGADPKMVFDVITHGAGNSLAFESRAPNVFARDFSPRGVIDIFTKDLGIVSDVARNLEFPLPLMTAALQQYLAAAARGYGRDDDASVVKIYEEITGVDVATAYESGSTKDTAVKTAREDA